jgi:hypothetical protein
MFGKFIAAMLLAIASFEVAALEYTDVYYSPTESGWGAFLVQSNTFQFIAFFIYGSDGRPTWYTAQLTDDGTGKYTGPLYATSGTPFASPWNPAQLTAAPAGTATFQPIDIYHATLTYTVNGVGTVVKQIQRQTLTSYTMDGRYSGSMAGSVSGCVDPTSNDSALRARYVLDVTKVADTSVTLVFTFVDMTHDGLVCTINGPLSHYGRIYQMTGATTVACTGLGNDGKVRPATLDSLHPTGQGIEGKLSGMFGGGCSGSLHFAAVLNVNN